MGRCQTPVECRKSLRWGHAEALSESLRHSLLRLETSLVRLWYSIMRLLADNGVHGEFGRTREPIPLLRCHLQTHATRGSHHTQPSPLIQASFLLLRLGGWCPPGGTPSVAKAISILSLANPICCNAWMHCAFPSSEGSGIR